MRMIDRQKTLQFVPGKRVLRADEFSNLVKSNEMVSTAEIEARALAKKTAEEAQITIQKACEEAKRIVDEAQAAFEEEKKKGFATGLDAGKQEMVNQMMELVAKNAAMLDQFEESVVGIVSRAIRRILGEIDQEELIRRLVRNSLQVARNQKRAVVRVNPQQAAAVRSSVSEYLKHIPGLEFVEVIADSRLKINECLLETEIGVIDASLNVQLEAIQRSMGKVFTG